MSNNQSTTQTEFYPIERLLVVGPLSDASAFAGKAEAAGHSITLMVPDEEVEQAGDRFRILQTAESVDEDDFDVVLELHCVDLAAKADALLYLEDALGESVPILTLTLAVSAGEVAREMLMPERVVGISMLPPFEDATLVEIMGTPHTSGDAVRTAMRLFESIGLMTVSVQDSPGGILARAVCCLVNEAALAMQERIASAEEIDLALRAAAGYPFGPLTWGDRIGLDRVLMVIEGLYAEFKDERYRPAPYLKRLVRAGHTGVRARLGFFSYV
ncbi:3-hydroxybutyryl-CoA dehydrogenase [candidate division KSB1 bacterium]|nr:MAG: 3-hydroxybutyryl-CoA dehydrogenase [candidate division KSB1 bacterium]